MEEYFIAIDIGGTNLRFALIDDKQNILKRTHILTSSIKNSVNFLEVLKEQVEILSTDHKVKKVAIVLPAPYRKECKRIIDITNIPCIENIEYAEIKRVLSDYKIYFENDVNVVALLESKVGIGQGSDNLIYITFSTGVGSGMVVRGEIYNGANGYAGEIGSLIIDSTKENFNDGTLENLCSGNALKEKAIKVYGKDKSAEYIFEMYQKNDYMAKEIVDEWVKNTSTGIVNVVQLFDPEIIVLGGPIIFCNKWIRDMVYENVKSRLLGKLSEKLKIETTSFGSDAGLLGAMYYSKTNI